LRSLTVILRDRFLLSSSAVQGTVGSAVGSSFPRSWSFAKQIERAQFLLKRRRVFTLSIAAEEFPWEEEKCSHLWVIGGSDSLRAAVRF
jgi:hypothetical protein